MPRELSAADRDDLTSDEIAAIMGDNSQSTDDGKTDAVAGTEDPPAGTPPAAAAKTDDDGEPAKLPTAEEIAAAAEAAAAKAGEGAETLSAEDLQALVDDDATPAPAAPKPVTYKGIDEAGYKAEVGKLDTQKAEGLQQLMDGTLDAAGYAKIESEVAAKRDVLVADRTLARANEQAEAQTIAERQEEFQGHVAALLKSSKGQAIDYNTDAKAQNQFDQASNMIALDPANANLSPREVADQANRMVHALRGVALPGAATPPAAAAPAAAKVPAVKGAPPPVTLGGLPAAAQNATGNDLRSQFNQLTGEDAEEFLERLPKAQREALLSGAAV